MRTANPALNPKFLTQSGRAASAANAMTVAGSVNKTAVLLILAMLPAVWVWNRYAGNPAGAMPWMLGGLIGGGIAALVTIFVRRAAPVSAPLYAILEGFFLGAISLIYEKQSGGIVMQAVGLTFGTMFVLLGVYRAGIIKVTDKFRLGVVAATGGIALIYLVSIVLGFFGIGIPLIHDSGTVGILFSLFVVGIASMNLVLDFDFIERGAAQGAPKNMEWYAAFGLMVTLVWLYLEMLRLLSKLNRR